MESHKDYTRKKGSEFTLEDEGELIEEFSDSWGILMDKGFQGAQTEIRSTIPSKKPRTRSLTSAEKRRNEKVSADRIIVENFFGREVTLWKVLDNRFNWKETSYTMISQICRALTNHHIRYNQLRAEDGDHYDVYRRRLASFARKRRARRDANKKNYQRRRQSRLMEAGEDSDSDTVNNCNREREDDDADQINSLAQDDSGDSSDGD